MVKNSITRFLAQVPCSNSCHPDPDLAKVPKNHDQRGDDDGDIQRSLRRRLVVSSLRTFIRIFVLISVLGGGRGFRFSHQNDLWRRVISHGAAFLGVLRFELLLQLLQLGLDR